jgi:hypothetical protein
LETFLLPGCLGETLLDPGWLIPLWWFLAGVCFTLGLGRFVLPRFAPLSFARWLLVVYLSWLGFAGLCFLFWRFALGYW